MKCACIVHMNYPPINGFKEIAINCKSKSIHEKQILLLSQEEGRALGLTTPIVHSVR